MEVSYPEAGEFYAIALSLFQSPVQMAFKETAPVVVSIDISVTREEHRPCCLRGALQDDFVNHAHSPETEPCRCQLEAFWKVSCFSRSSM